jgi:hypothetical protein
MTYDGARHQIVLFGGFGDYGYYGDTWTWNGFQWALRPSPPSARDNASMAYDPATKQVILFGGEGQNAVAGSSAATTAVLGDTWIWNGSRWRPGPTGPKPRYDANLTYDSTHRELVLFGGAAGSGELADTWTWNGSRWQARQNGPPGRTTSAALIDDPGAHGLILYGGQDNSGNPIGDTWLWNGHGWASLAAGPARGNAAVGYDPISGLIVLASGYGCSNPGPCQTSTATVVQDSWTFDGQHWQQVQGASPPAREFAVFVADPTTRQLVLCGGGNPQADLQDTWTWS